MTKILSLDVAQFAQANINRLQLAISLWSAEKQHS
jgi:hypothetical protein